MTDSYVSTDGKGNFFKKAAVEQPDGSFADLVFGELSAGSQYIGKTGIALKQVVGTVITRPSDTTAYAAGDAISNSTSAPTLCEFDLAEAGLSAGESFEIRRLVLAIDAKPAILPIITAYLTRTSFAHGVAGAVLADNSPLAIPHAINESGGAMLLCDLQSSGATNCRCAYVSPSIDMILAPDSTKLYMCLQAANAFTPTSGMKITPIMWAVRL
jgi:hypothetical protein